MYDKTMKKQVRVPENIQNGMDKLTDKTKDQITVTSVPDTKDPNLDSDSNKLHHDCHLPLDAKSCQDIVPHEIDTHFQLYGKHAWEVEYGERCSVCNRKIDEYGFCACGSQGE
jgi:hypothetical protein